MKKIFSRVLSIFLYIIIFLLIAFIINSLYSTAVKKVPSYFGYSVLRILTNSMADEIKAGDYILVKKVPKSNLKVSDIITFYSSDPHLSGAPNTHRIAEINGESITTKGDANAVADSYKVSYDKVIGKYKGKVSFQLLRELFINKWLFFGIIIIPLLIFIVFEFIKIVKLKLEQISK